MANSGTQSALSLALRRYMMRQVAVSHRDALVCLASGCDRVIQDAFLSFS